MRLYLEELEVWVLIVYQKSIISLPCQEPIFLLLSNILLSIKSYIDRSAGAFETCIIRWNLLIFLCDLTHWHCPLCPKNVGFEIFNKKQFKNWVAISIFYKNKSWNIFNHQIYMNSVSSKTSDKDFRYILSKAWTVLLTIQYFKNFLIFSVWGQYLMVLKYKAEVAIMLYKLYWCVSPSYTTMKMNTQLKAPLWIHWNRNKSGGWVHPPHTPPLQGMQAMSDDVV